MLNEPIRKRAYHRALKRGEYWALRRQQVTELCDMFYRRGIYEDEKWAKAFGLHSEFMGLRKTIEINTKTQGEDEKS